MAPIQLYHSLLKKAKPAEIVDASWGGGWSEKTGPNSYLTGIPAGQPDAWGVLRSPANFLGGLFYCEMKTISANSGVSGFYLYADENNEIDIEVYGRIEDPNDKYAGLHPEHAELLSWKRGDRQVYRTRMGFDASQDWHKWAFIWIPNKEIDWFIDDIYIGQMTGDFRVPDVEMPLHLHTMHSSWMGPPPSTDAITLFRNVLYAPLPSSKMGWIFSLGIGGMFLLPLLIKKKK